MLRALPCLVLLVLCTSVACKKKETAKTEVVVADTIPEPALPKEISYYTQTLYRSIDSCALHQPNCTYVRMIYPVIENGPNPATTDSIKARIGKMLQVADYGLTDPVAIADSFLGAYKKYHKAAWKRGEKANPWYLRKDVEIIYSSTSYLSISAEEKSYMGGAHGEEKTTFYNFDLTTGKSLGLTDVIMEDKLDTLSQMAEHLFRLTKKIPPGKKLSSEGYFVFAPHDSLEGKFYLTENFSVGHMGLVFYYNVYEMAPYASGASKIVIPYKKLEGFVRKGSLLDEKMHGKS